jgi:hypothetical protein
MVVLLAACAPTRTAEVGKWACSNHEDDDHDGLFDCNDPDCQYLDLCRRTVASEDAGTLGDAARPEGGSVKPPARMDAGVTSRPDEDAGRTGDEDGGGNEIPLVDGGPTCKPACATTEACIDLTCTPVSAQEPGQYSLTILQAVVPDATPYLMMCLDISCPETTPVPSIPFGLCSCPVDPYVVVTLTRGNKPPMVIGMTSVQIDTDTPIFDDPAITVQIMAGDVIRFQVFDKDDDSPDDLIFTCPLNLTDLTITDPITCTPAPNPYTLIVPSVTYTLKPKK